MSARVRSIAWIEKSFLPGRILVGLGVTLRRWLPTVIRSITLVAVVVGIALTIRRAWQDESLRALDWSRVGWPWLLAATAAYGLGTLPGWRYWHAVLLRFGQRPTPRESLRAFMMGQLGKYLPGKAMVVAIRAATVRSDRTLVAPAAAAVFVETLTLMAVGATVAASYLVFWAWQEPAKLSARLPLLGLAVVLMLVAGVPTYPPLFRRLVRFIRLRKADPSIEQAVAGLDGGLLARGWGWNLLAWGCWGASLFCVLSALPGADPSWIDLPLITACVALAMVAGFLSLLPGGIGVRELVILTLLAPFGSAQAIVAAVLLRLCWLLSELVIATILYLWGNGPAPASETREGSLD